MKSHSQRFQPDLIMAVWDFVRTVVSSEEVEGVLVLGAVADLVS